MYKIRTIENIKHTEIILSIKIKKITAKHPKKHKQNITKGKNVKHSDTRSTAIKKTK